MREIRRVFATHTGGWIGDMVLLSPALRALRTAFPSAVVTLQVRHLVRELMERHPHVNRIVVWDKTDSERGLEGFFDWARRLRREAYDTAIVWHPTSVRSAALAWVAGIPVRIGHRVAFREAFLTRSLPDAYVHETERYLRVLRLLDVPAHLLNNRHSFFWHSDDDRAFAERFFDERRLRDAPVVGINLGTTWRTKAWELGRTIEVARRLLRTGVKILVTGSASESLRRDVFAARLGADSFADAVGRCDLFQLAALIERCRVYLTPDSGPMHIASAVGTRVVALFGPTSPVRHGPLGERDAVLQASLPCVPCYKPQCHLRDDPYLCMRRLSVEETVNAVLGALDDR
jgi:lipopolysaccharide heptosyltransferase II